MIKNRFIQLTLDASALVIALGFVFTGLYMLSIPTAFADTPGDRGCTQSEIAQQADQSWHFRVYLGKREIGCHSFLLDERGEETVLNSFAHFEYRLMFLTLYSYQHDNVEYWNGDCLKRIESNTNDNGDKLFLLGERQQDEAFTVNAGDGETILTGCVRSYAYWSPEILGAAQLLNPQNGSYSDVRLGSPEPVMFSLAGEEIPASRYRLVSESADIDLWYSLDGHWLGLQTLAPNGQVLRYELDGNPPLHRLASK
jgi:hypothetical protein